MSEGRRRGSPFAPHTPEEAAAMCEAIKVDSTEDLFDIPEGVQYGGAFGIEARTEREVRQDFRRMFSRNDRLIEFLGQGHYEHYVPSLVDHLADRSEFLTSYTQYQPEVAQGFLQALFEYQSIVSELTGLEIANCSMYDHATALGEAALLADRVGNADAPRVLVPDTIDADRRSVLENYTAGPGIAVESYPMEDGNVDRAALADQLDDDVVMVSAESPNTHGVIEEALPETAALAHECDALCVLGSDPIALALLEEPGHAGVDVVVGDAASLGLGRAYGMGLGMFATRERYVRGVPGRLVGASEDAAGQRAYTLTLQTREQHIRRERATSNICTNQAWVALRAAMHAAALGPDGLVDLATQCVEFPAALAPRIDAIDGFMAPVHDRHHFREFLVRCDQPARAVAADLTDRGFAVHVAGEHRLGVCVTETNAEAMDALVTAFGEAA